MNHLFRHQFGKMVSILTRLFGFEHLETIEDAVQDTFIQALRSWPMNMPENPEAWLTAAAKNRVLDIFRSIKAENLRKSNQSAAQDQHFINDLFLDHEIEDSQLRMIFTACHPLLDSKDQIAFALRTISGFSIKEIAAALLVQTDTIKKRLQRARKSILKNNIQFEIPDDNDIHERIERVLEVIYIVFSEGFHSNKKDLVIRKDLCGEALRLSKLMLKNPRLRTSNTYALMALMCFHSARLDSKINDDHELIPLSQQDRATWYFPLIAIANDAMNKAIQLSDQYSSYHYEAAIAFEHAKAPSYDLTHWPTIADWYIKLLALQYNPYTALNLAVVHIELGDLEQAYLVLIAINPVDLAQKAYLYHATMAKYYHLSNRKMEAVQQIDQVLTFDLGKAEIVFFKEKRKEYDRYFD